MKKTVFDFGDAPIHTADGKTFYLSDRIERGASFTMTASQVEYFPATVRVVDSEGAAHARTAEVTVRDDVLSVRLDNEALGVGGFDLDLDIHIKCEVQMS